MGSCDDVELPPSLNDLDIGVVLHDPETGEILDVNDRLLTLYGYRRQQLLNLDVADYTPPSTKFTQQEALNRIQAAANGDPQDFEWQVERENGELRWVRVHLNPTTINQVECVLAEIKDITEYRAREQRLRLLSRIIRHNLRNQATALMGYTDRIKQAVEDETLEKELDTIIDISTEVGTLSDSVRQLEEIAEPDATERSATDLRRLVKPVFDEFRNEHTGADFTFEAVGDVHVVADRGLRYAVEHAIENAIEHNDQATPVVSVIVADDSERNRGVIRIADNGPQIPETEVKVLNEEVEASSTYHGTGVGLWVMRWCVDSLGGELFFEENSPRGNIIVMELPKVNEQVNQGTL
jgi:PAS domain S-box-containing protein